MQKRYTIGTFYRKIYNGGVEKILAELLGLWVSMGHSVILFTEEESNELDYDYPSDVKRIVIPDKSNMTKRLSTIESAVKSEEIDIYITHSWQNNAVEKENRLFKSLKVPYVVYTHSNFDRICNGNMYGFDSYKVFRDCSMIISLNSMSARYYQLCGCNSYLIKNPIPNKLLSVQANEIRFDNKHILWIGRISHEKRLQDAIEAFKIVKRTIPDAVLDVVGDGSTDGLDIPDGVILHGYTEAPDKFYEKAAMLLITSEQEGSPTVLLESKAYGLPCVSSDLSYLTFIEEGDGILTAPVGDTESFASQMIRIFSDSELYENMSHKSRESFDKLLEYDYIGDWNEVFDICIHNNVDGNRRGYYSPNELSAADKGLVPTLIDSLKSNTVKMINNSNDYRVGRKVLTVPRKIKKWLRFQ